jgi:hypothetical protein
MYHHLNQLILIQRDLMRLNPKSVQVELAPLFKGEEMHPIEEILAEKRQVGGSHYTEMPIEPWEIIERNNLNYWEGNVLKYLLRYKYKGGVEDLEKAKHYIDYLIEYTQRRKNELR